MTAPAEDGPATSVWDSPPMPTSRSARVGLTVAGVAVLLVVVLAIGYAAVALSGKGQAATSQGNVPESTAPVSPTPTPPVSEERLITPEQAKFLEPASKWATARTQEGRDGESPVATCLARPGTNDTPADITNLRTLTATGKRPMALFHEASAYADRDAAMHVFGVVARQLGGCTAEGAYLDGSRTVDALGNQALTVTISVTPPGQQGAKPEYHTVLVARTGRVINIADVAAPDKFVDPKLLAETFAVVINEQCVDAIGLCAQRPTVTTVVPPIGGEFPGLPVLADIPRLPKMTGHWSATEPARDPELTEGTQCERLGSAKAKPTATIARAYLVQDDDTIPQTYGWDMVMFTMSGAKEADQFLNEVSTSIEGCDERQRTAKVGTAEKFTGAGTSGTTVQVTTWTIRQQTGSNAKTDFMDFRVALVKAGNKVVYLFLPLEEGVNYSDAQWKALTIRVGQRATQIS